MTTPKNAGDDSGAKDPVKLVALCGSLRKQSFNRSLLHAAAELMPADVQLEHAEIGEIPLYNQDVLDQQGFPAPVQRLIDAIAAADGVLIATPEYNYSVPGVLKNAIDWVSRSKDSPFSGKTLGILSASPGALGGARAQYHLRQIVVFLNLIPFNRPEVMVSKAAEKFDTNGRLTDEDTRKHLGAFMKGLSDFTRKLRRA